MVKTVAPDRRATDGPPTIQRLIVPRAPRAALAIPFTLGITLFALAWVPSVHANQRLAWSFLGADLVLLAWGCVVAARIGRQGRHLRVAIALRPQHYVQACAQLSVLLYWGWYWRQVYDSAVLIGAQLLFAYVFDMLLCWSRQDEYTLGFGPFPVIFSINLFLWFKADWFYLQFAMIALGFAAKHFIRWSRDGQRTHIFNPSSFPLGVFSLVLLLTHTTNLTWGPEIAETQFRPPYIYLWIFLVGLPGQFLFGVTTMIMSAVVTMLALGLLHLAWTGTYAFFEGIPIAVFLGMHLLFTDPSTSPRTELGRIFFGVAYAVGVTLLAPSVDFYDKLLPVPLLNLCVRAIDRAARSTALRQFDPAALGRGLAPSRRRLAYISIWTTAFVLINATHSLGHASRGYWLPFWQEACRTDRPDACKKLAFLESTYCQGGSGWACNDLGQLIARLRPDDRAGAAESFQRACDLSFTAGCGNAARAVTGANTWLSAPPTRSDYEILLMEGSGPLTDATPLALYARACDQGWMDGCSAKQTQQP